MAARKPETAAFNHGTAAGSTFWRQSSSAIPGRVKSGGRRFGGPAPSAAVSAGAAAHSFEHFQDSVSDAWEIEEPPSLQRIVTEKQTAAGSGGAAVTSSPASNEKSSKSNSNITPVHTHNQVRYRYWLVLVPTVPVRT